MTKVLNSIRLLWLYQALFVLNQSLSFSWVYKVVSCVIGLPGFPTVDAPFSYNSTGRILFRMQFYLHRRQLNAIISSGYRNMMERTKKRAQKKLFLHQSVTLLLSAYAKNHNRTYFFTSIFNKNTRKSTIRFTDSLAWRQWCFPLYSSILIQHALSIDHRSIQHRPSL